MKFLLFQKRRTTGFFTDAGTVDFDIQFFMVIAERWSSTLNFSPDVGIGSYSYALDVEAIINLESLPLMLV